MKLQKIGDIQPTLPFTEYDFLKKYRESFAVSELGRIRALLPLKEMADELASHFPKKHSRGNTPTARRIIGNLRATVMEGSFGNQKQHFGVGRIAARNRHSETLLLFFGIHMANTAILAARQLAVELRQKEKKRA